MQVTSPGGIPFGIEGYTYGEIKPSTITFFLDGTAIVADHRGNAIEKLGDLIMPMRPPLADDDNIQARAKFPKHAEVIKELSKMGVDWQKLIYAGWPQLEYDELKEIANLPPTTRTELLKIRNKSLRADALKMREEADSEALALAEAS